MVPPPQNSPIDDLFIVIRANLLLQTCLIIPLIGFSMWLFGYYITWGSLIVVTILFSLRTIVDQKRRKYAEFMNVEESLAQGQFEEDQYCAWLNLLIAKYWKTCVPAWVKPQIEKTNQLMQEKKPGFMQKLEIGEWQLGDRPPRIDKAFTLPGLSEDKYEIDANIHFIPDFKMEILVQPFAKLLLKVLLSDVKFKGRIRISFAFDDLFPDSSVVSVSFVGTPLIECSVRPFQKYSLDVLATPFIYDWVNEIINTNLKTRLLWPQKLTFSFGGGTVETSTTVKYPITDIAIIRAIDKKAPPGYILLERTCSGLLPADINRGTKGVSMFICYKRQQEESEKPITDLCVFFPSLGEFPPEGFETIEETPSGESAALNAGNPNVPEGFIAFKRGEGKPIRGLTLFNESEYAPFPETHQLLQITPTGHLANLNKKSGGDRLFIAYRGGCKSYFGYKRPFSPKKGFIRILLIEGRDIKAADVGGTSDPFCELIIGDPKFKESPRKFSSVIDKTLSPKWNETFVFPVSTDNILTVNLYDKDLVGKPDFLGRLQIPLNTLVIGKTVDQWFDLQLVSHGQLHLRIVALDFGLSDDNPVTQLVQLECPKEQGNFLTDAFDGLGAIGGTIGGVGMKVGGVGVKAVTTVGGTGIKAVTTVGGTGIKAVTTVGGTGFKAVTTVGGTGFKAVTTVGDAGAKAVGGVVGGIGGAVGGIFGAGKSQKRKSLTTSREEIATRQLEISSQPLVYRSKQGQLEKIGHGFRSSLGFGSKKRSYHVVLEENFLLINRSKEKLQDAKKTDITNAEVELAEDQKLCFSLKIDEEISLWRAPTEADLQEWVIAIRNNAAKAQVQ